LCSEELHGEGIYTFEDGVQGSSCEFGSDSRNKEESEDDIGEGDEEDRVQENSEWHEEGNQQVNGHQHDNAKYGDGVRGKIQMWLEDKVLNAEELNAIL